MGALHPAIAAPSSEHWNVEPDSVDVNANVAVFEPTVPDGPLVMLVSGGVVSCGAAPPPGVPPPPGPPLELGLGLGDSVVAPPDPTDEMPAFTQLGSWPVSQLLLNVNQSSLWRSCCVSLVTAPGVPSGETRRLSPPSTWMIPCEVSTATSPDSTLISVDPSGNSSSAHSVPCTDAVAVGVATSTRLWASVSFVIRLKVLPEVWSPTITFDRAGLWSVSRVFRRNVVEKSSRVTLPSK